MERQMACGAGVRALLLSGAMSLGVVAPAMAQQAAPTHTDRHTATSAQDATSAPTSSDSDQIIVTARRVEENLQSVPVTVTAITPRQMEIANIYDSYTLLSEVPGVAVFSKIPGNNLLTGLTRVRGVNPVATYFADVPYPAQQWTLYAPFFDIQNVQILKGPQGTLFGQASNAGAEVIMPVRPGETFGGTLESEVGNYGYREVQGALDVPIVPGQVLFRISGKNSFRDGYIRDILSNATMGQEDYDIARASLIVKPTSFLENYTMVQQEHIRNTGNPGAVIGDYDFSTNGLSGVQAALNGMTPAQWNSARDEILARQLALGPYKFQGWSIGCPASPTGPATVSTVPGPNVDAVHPQGCAPGAGHLINYALANTTTLSLGNDFTLKNIIGHVWGKFRQGLFDTDSSRLILIDVNPRSNQYWNPYPESWSDELQFSGKLFNGRMDFVSGLFWYDERLRVRNPGFSIFFSSLNQSANSTETNSRRESIYGQVNYHLDDFVHGLTATFGVREDWDYAYRLLRVYNPTTLAVTSTTGGHGNPGGEGRWDALSYTAGLQYQVTPDTMFYFTNAKGHSAGGLQSVTGHEQYEPDTLNNFEIGSKSTFNIGDVRLRTDLAAYYGFYDQVKVQTVVVTTLPGGGQSFIGAIANAGQARIRGLEAEVDGSLPHQVEFRAFAAYSDAYYTRFPSFTSTGTPLDLSNTPFLNTPRWKVGFSPTYHIPMDNRYGDVSIGADYTFTSRYWVNTGKPLTPSNPANPDTGAICRERRTAANGYGPLSADGGWAYKDCSPALYNLNMRFGWDNFMGQSGLDASIIVTNVTQNDTAAGVSSVYDSLNFNEIQPNAPRFVYATLRYSF
jgi:iron complex outermembrane receptor protein